MDACGFIVRSANRNKPTSFLFQLDPSVPAGLAGRPSNLHLVRADVELAEDVAEEVLDLVPRVDAVGAIQHDYDVHVCGAPWEGGGVKADERNGIV